MAEFQFYRPQANALEQLWSQYAEAKGKTGGAYLRGVTPGIESGLGAIADQIEKRNDQAYEDKVREDVQTFQTEERKAGQVFQRQEAQTERWWKSDEAKLDRALQREEITGRATAATSKLKAEEDAALKAAQDAQEQAAATLVAGGLKPEDASSLAGIVKDGPGAERYLEQQRKREAERRDAEKRNQEQRDLEAKRSSAVGLVSNLRNPFVDQNVVNQLDTDLRSSDYKVVSAASDQLTKLEAERSSRITALSKYEGYRRNTSSAVLKQQGRSSAVTPENQQAFDALNIELAETADLINNSKWWTVATPQDRLTKLEQFDRSLIKANALATGSSQDDAVISAKLQGKGYVQLDRIRKEGRPIYYSNGSIGGAGVTDTIKSQVNQHTNDLLRDDQTLRMLMQGVGMSTTELPSVDKEGKLNLTNLLAAADANGATPEQTRQIKDRIKQVKKEGLQALGIQVQEVIVPDGMVLYEATEDMTPEQKTQLTTDYVNGYNAFQKENGRTWTSEESAVYLASKGYYDLDFPQYTKERAQQVLAPVGAANAKTWDGYPAYKNPDGSISTEVTITVTDPRLNNGKPTNIPTLWEGKPLAGSQAQIQESAIKKAVDYQKTSGQKWKSFDNIKSAVGYAETKSAQGGNRSGSLFDRTPPVLSDVDLQQQPTWKRRRWWQRDAPAYSDSLPSVVNRTPSQALPSTARRQTPEQAAMIRLLEQNKKK